MKKLVFIVFLLVIAFSSCNMLTNEPPNTPGSPSPQDNATGVNLATTLTWNCTDPNGDPLTYDVYFGTNPNPITKEGEGLTTASKNVAGLTTYSTDYYWKVVAKDGRGGETSSSIWKFTTKDNEAPNTPHNPFPANNAQNLSLNINMEWECTDPEGDPLTYDFYFGKSSNPPLHTAGISSKNKLVGGLDNYTMYYWKIIAKDDHGNEISSPVWHFRTKPYVVIDEDFESRPIGVPNLPWADYVHTGGAYAQIYDSGASHGKVLDFYDPNNSDSAQIQTSGGWSGLTKGLIKFDFYMWDSDGWSGVRSWSDNPYIGIGYINSKLTLYTWDSGLLEIMEISTYTWYTVEIIFNFTTHEFTLYVNSMFKGTFSMSAGTTYLNGIRIMTFGNRSCVWIDYDNFKVYSYTPGWSPSPEFVEPVSFDNISTLSTK
jgi:hypothetical protein